MVPQWRLKSTLQHRQPATEDRRWNFAGSLVFVTVGSIVGGVPVALVHWIVYLRWPA